MTAETNEVAIAIQNEKINGLRTDVDALERVVYGTDVDPGLKAAVAANTADVHRVLTRLWWVISTIGGAAALLVLNKLWTLLSG